jgi:hypothetical protein
MTAKLHIMRLDLPGQWSDAWLYKEHLIAWARDGRMHVLPLSDIYSWLRELEQPALEVLADFLIFRNDWKTSEQFGRLFSLRGIEESFIANFPEATGELVIPLEEASPVPVGSDQVPGTILDSAIYANCVYVGSTRGLFETRFDPDNPMGKNFLAERMSKRVSTVTAAYSAVNGSAGQDGLWFSRIDPHNESWRREKGTFEQVADLSRGNSFADVNLLNYTDQAFPGFLRSKTIEEKSPDTSVRETRQITGYHESASIAGLTASALALSRATSDEDIEVLGNSGKRLLVAWNESLRVLDVSLQRRRGLEVKQDKSYQGIADLGIDPYKILDTHAFGNGKSFLVELSNEVRLINSQGSFTLISEPVARIRTFARSRRYREVVLLVRETGLSLLGMYVKQEPA